MAVPDWDQVKAESTRDQITYEEYTKLYLNDWTKTLLAPTTQPILPEWILPLFRPYEEQVRTATRIEVSQDPATSSTIIRAHCPDGGTIGIRIPDEVLASINLDTSFLVEPPLPIVSSPYPILGWRIWLPREDTMYGYYNKPWASPLLVATCHHNTNTPPPHEGLRMRCGIYLLKEPHTFASLTSVSAYIIGLAVAERVIEHEYGYRAGLVRCIALSGQTTAPGWDGIPIMSAKDLGEYEQFLRSNPESIPYPDDLPAP